MNKHVAKLLLFAALMVGFYALGGFERPRVEQADYRSNPKTGRAWVATVFLVLAGTILALWGNQIAENVDWDIPAGAYPAIGVLLLLASVLWMLMVKDVARM